MVVVGAGASHGGQLRKAGTKHRKRRRERESIKVRKRVSGVVTDHGAGGERGGKEKRRRKKEGARVAGCRSVGLLVWQTICWSVRLYGCRWAGQATRGSVGGRLARLPPLPVLPSSCRPGHSGSLTGQVVTPGRPAVLRHGPEHAVCASQVGQKVLRVMEGDRVSLRCRRLLGRQSSHRNYGAMKIWHSLLLIVTQL